MMRSTSIFLLIASVLTFSFSSFSLQAQNGAMHQHNMPATAAMAEINTSDNSATLYSASGVVKAWRDDAVVIAHAPVAQLNWPAMTMRFAIGDSRAEKLAVGQQVSFIFRQTDSGYALVSISAQ